ncbi:hypothetical protein HYPSUDRAFT_200299 [Hypholoma sublateritium FD-334 SS-4]|uniref:Uncharacterized protein n=1 Tax=Hypholoma sublateritium (strain FD-334 SS-4) TaxID=945553 RepID=A0A0D2P1H6_HYPSF|nr:hypothetical protein HYPSUDRAFT_200299 [Hypholoma sublateritium FD-334 SS-4]
MSAYPQSPQRRRTHGERHREAPTGLVSAVPSTLRHTHISTSSSAHFCFASLPPSPPKLLTISSSVAASPDPVLTSPALAAVELAHLPMCSEYLRFLRESFLPPASTLRRSIAPTPRSFPLYSIMTSAPQLEDTIAGQSNEIGASTSREPRRIRRTAVGSNISRIKPSSTPAAPSANAERTLNAQNDTLYPRLPPAYGRVTAHPEPLARPIQGPPPPGYSTSDICWPRHRGLGREVDLHGMATGLAAIFGSIIEEVHMDPQLIFKKSGSAERGGHVGSHAMRRDPITKLGAISKAGPRRRQEFRKPISGYSAVGALLLYPLRSAFPVFPYMQRILHWILTLHPHLPSSPLLSALPPSLPLACGPTHTAAHLDHSVRPASGPLSDGLVVERSALVEATGKMTYQPKREPAKLYPSSALASDAAAAYFGTEIFSTSVVQALRDVRARFAALSPAMSLLGCARLRSSAESTHRIAILLAVTAA